MATRLQDYFGSKNLGLVGGTFNNPRYNDFSDWRDSADGQVLKNTGLRSRLAHDALMRGQAAQAAADNELLATATPDELANLYGQPRTEREIRLQRIVQRDHDARHYGAQLIPNEKQKLNYELGKAALQTANIENYLNPLRFDLARSKFAEEQAKNFHDFINQNEGRSIQRDQLAATQQYREMQRQNAEANRNQRAQFQGANFNQRERFHGDTVANQGLQGMMEMERMLQAAANGTQRQQNFEANFNRDYFGDVAAAANAGALSPAQLDQFAARFDPATMAILRGYANIGANALGAGGSNPAPSASAGYLSRLQNMPIPVPGTGMMIPNPFGGRTATGSAADEIMFPDDEEDETFGMGGDFSMPAPTPAPAMAARPAAPQQRGNFQPGAIVRNRQTGQVFRVLPNGQLQPVRG